MSGFVSVWSNRMSVLNIAVVTPPVDHSQHGRVTHPGPRAAFGKGSPEVAATTRAWGASNVYKGMIVES